MICKPTELDGVRGLAVLITDGDDEQEVGRVAFVRKQSTNPKADFPEQLDAVLERADRAAAIVNDSMYELERMRDEADSERDELERKALADAREKVREVVASAQAEKVVMS